MLYCDCQFTRTSGLGNKLFPWARCYLFSKERDAKMLAPHWTGVRRGPIMRGGAVTGGVPLASLLGKIFLYGNFKPISLAARIEKWQAYRKAVLVEEGAFTPYLASDDDREVLVRFTGDRNHFADLSGHAASLLSALRACVRPSILRNVDQKSVPPIILNVRVGRDFRFAADSNDFLTQGALLTPLEWYKQVINEIRKRVGVAVPALVISDGGDRELKPLLDLTNVSRLASTTAIEDLLILSRGQVIIGTGGSSFSAWGAFFAQSHVITIKGQDLSWFRLNDATEAHVVAWDEGGRECPFVDDICQVLL